MQYEDKNGVNEPSRRRLLKGIGALALAGSCPVAHAQKTQSAPGTLSPVARNEKQPFYGEHQAGILTPQQAAMMLVAFDVLASDKADLPNDSLDAALCHGDVLLQICANTQDTVIHALRDIIKHTPDLLSVRWKREGFISDHAARSKGKETPINLLGFKDGTANPDSQNDKLMQKVVWVTADQQEPAWTIGGSYQAVRLIQFRVEFWDRTPLKEQQTIFGRDKQTGAPLGMQHEHDVPDYASDPEGKGIALDSHIRLANPRTAESESSLMLRRGYSYSLGVTNSGQLDMGLLFVCYQHDLEKGFLTVQKRLNGEALEEYVKPIGGGYFFALPGVKDANDYLGSALLRV
ncbi:Dyp-type peroxidase [Escherichia coli]|nr:Dyp-type peroxidase [Escherichia coli]EIV1256226.1 Dyp-type peroxidase [Escherichia coli]EJS7294723.1 Dyp-type peroxidase [Escherichia coli]EKH8252597.1 Dyp-type peroxidase [Escherichia coli]